jgi:(2R)-3-sulfolactate dehydrogenase (NADP+)
MSATTVLTYAEIEALAAKALTASDVSPANAGPVARSIAAAERDGQAIVGLSYLPTYCDHAACGKVDGHATPRLERLSPVAIRVDAATGFAHPAIALGMRELTMAARDNGLAALAVGNSYACGSLGFFVEELAEQGLVALMAANASPSIAPFGGKTPFFGTNPLAFAAPRKGRAPLVIDQSSSVVAKVAVIDAYNKGVPLPDGWAIDSDGVPTNDAAAAMQGSLLPIGGYKGFGLALMVDILAAGLTRSHWSFEASSFGDCEGGPPRTGQFIIALDPKLLGGEAFGVRLEEMLSAAQETPYVRLPGDRRLAARKKHERGMAVPTDVVETVRQYAVDGSPELRKGRS